MGASRRAKSREKNAAYILYVSIFSQLLTKYPGVQGLSVSTNAVVRCFLGNTYVVDV